MRSFFIFCRIFLSVVALSAFQLRATAQRKCWTMHMDSIHAHSSPKYLKSREDFEASLFKHIESRKASRTHEDERIYTIPVVVHVIHDSKNNTIGGTNNSNISDEQIASQIEVLNADFRRKNADTADTRASFLNVVADIRIEFCLASLDPNGNPTSGITRHYSPQLPFNLFNQTSESRIKSFGYWPSDSYLNIWVTELDGGILGYAQFPSQSGLSGLESNSVPENLDGVVIDHRSFGNNIGTSSSTTNPYRFGRTTTHEVGHWLGLFHIWGDEIGCGLGTDFCADTPDQEQESKKCPLESASCGKLNMIENFMDYTYDVCMNSFTKDQKSRMRGSVEVAPRRKSLLSSFGCCPTKSIVYPSYNETFENNQYVLNGWDTSTTNLIPYWTKTSSIGNTSLSSLVFESTNLTVGEKYRLTSPVYSTNDVYRPMFSFDVALPADAASDSLIFEYEQGCNGKWRSLRTWIGSQLITSSSSSSSTFLPNDADWKRINIPLDAFENTGIIKFRFMYVPSASHRKLFLDNVNFYARSNALQVSVYPNPSINELTLDIKKEEEGPLTVQFYDYLGNLVRVINYEKITSGKYTIDPTLVSGVYFISVISNKDVYKEKLVILSQ